MDHANENQTNPLGSSRDGARSTRLVLLAALLALGGCSGGAPGSNPPIGLPAPQQAGASFYLGTAGAQDPGANPITSTNYLGGVWTVTLNAAESQFSYRTASNFTPTGILPIQGITNFANGYLALTQTNQGGSPQAAGYALEMPGRAALMRPRGFALGTVSSPADPLLVLVNQGGCVLLGVSVTLQFVTLPDKNWNPVTDRAYGTIQANSSGATWNFSNLNERTLAGSPVKTPPLQAGLCNGGALGFAINVPSDTANNIPPTTIAIGPDGFFIADQGTAADPKGGLHARVGMLAPSDPVDTNAIVAGRYLGFLSKPAETAATQLIAFGQSPGSGPSLGGGIFPKDDPTQTAPANIKITLNAQDSHNNGLYPSAAVTLPDPGNCVLHGGGTGTDASGNPTCTMPAVAIVGGSGGKYVVYLISRDLTSGQTSSPMAIFLYQQ